MKSNEFSKLNDFELEIFWKLIDSFCHVEIMSCPKEMEWKFNVSPWISIGKLISYARNLSFSNPKPGSIGSSI